ncbi:MAG: hypothetical protein JNJ48_03630 [Phycisphaerae bacterium]|nr:hypothetical protein [Phycisphaerae bacterium]
MIRLLRGPGRFCEAAGLLAERSVASLELRRADGTVQRLRARVTDLPGALRQAGAGALLVSTDGSIRIEIRTDELGWEEGMEGKRHEHG